jgi:hypothetical protein
MNKVQDFDFYTMSGKNYIDAILSKFRTCDAPIENF